MAIILRCRDVAPDCDADMRGDTEAEILEQAGAHAQADHGLEVTPELVEVVRLRNQRRITAV